MLATRSLKENGAAAIHVLISHGIIRSRRGIAVVLTPLWRSFCRDQLYSFGIVAYWTARCELHAVSHAPFFQHFFQVTNTIPQKPHLFCAELLINGDVSTSCNGPPINAPDTETLETSASIFSHSTFANGELSTSTTNSPESSTPSSPRLIPRKLVSKMVILDVSNTIAESIRRTHNGESISLLFGELGEGKWLLLDADSSLYGYILSDWLELACPRLRRRKGGMSIACNANLSMHDFG